MRLAELTNSLNIERRTDRDIEISGIAYDSRLVKAGYLFVAIPGARFDGHDFIKQAVDLGAAAVIVEKWQTGLGRDITQLQVKEARSALAHISDQFYGHPSRKLKLIGVTGTNGKTTTVYLLESIFQAAGLKTGLIGTIEYRIDGERFSAQRTTPESLDLQGLLAAMVDKGVEVGVIEVSSHALQLKRIDGCVFAGRIFMNLSQDHLDFHSGVDEYFLAKARLFTEPSFGEGLRLVNNDDPFGRHIAYMCKGTVTTFGLSAADWRPVDINLSNSETSFSLVGPRDPAEKSGGRSKSENVAQSAGCPGVPAKPALRGEKADEVQGEGAYAGLRDRTEDEENDADGGFGRASSKTLSVKSPLIGAFNVSNLAASAAAAFELGVGPAEIARGLQQVDKIPGRFEVVACGQDFQVLVDYAHTPDGLEKVLSAAKVLAEDHRLITVFGCGGDRDRGKRPRMGAIAARLSDVAIVTSDNPRSESPKAIIDDILKGISNKDHSKPEIILERAKAIRTALAKAKTGDVVVIAGKGHEHYQILNDKTIPFDDRRIAMETLKEILSGTNQGR